MKHLFVSSTLKESKRTLLINVPHSFFFPSIQSAVNSIPKDTKELTVIHISAGIYHEKVTIQTPNVHLLGEGVDKTILTYSDAAYDRMIDGNKCGTFRSYTLFVDTHDFIAQNVTIQYDAGFGHTVGQAIAVYADGDRIHFEHCHLNGKRDYAKTILIDCCMDVCIHPNAFQLDSQFVHILTPNELSHYSKNQVLSGWNPSLDDASSVSSSVSSSGR